MNNKYKLQVERSGDNTITVLEHIKENKYKVHWTVTSKHDSEPVHFLGFYTETRFIYMNWHGTTKIYDIETKEELFNQIYGDSLTSKAMLSDDNKTLYIRTKVGRENCLIAINLETFEEIKRIPLPYDQFRYIRFCDKIGDKFYFYNNELKHRNFVNRYNIVDFETEEITTHDLPYPQTAKHEPRSPLLNIKNRKGIMPYWDKVEVSKNEKDEPIFSYKLMVFDIDTFEVEKIFPVLQFSQRMLSYFERDTDTMAEQFMSEEKEGREYDEALADFIQNLNTIRLSADRNSVWLCWRGGIVRRVDYNGSLSPVYVTASQPDSTLKGAFELFTFHSYLMSVKDDGLILQEHGNQVWMAIDDINKMDAKIEDFIGIELTEVDKSKGIEIVKSDKDLEEESERIYNVFKLGDFEKDEDVLVCLKSIDVSKISAKAHYIALLFKDKNGETYEENEFFARAISVKGAADIMEVIARDALKYGYKYKFGSNNEDHAYFNLFYNLVDSDKKYAQLGFEFLEEADLDHDVDNFPDMIDAISSNMSDEEFQKMLNENEHIKSYYEYFGYGD